MWSWICSVGNIDPLGILNASTTKVRSRSATPTATAIDSTYSRNSPFCQGLSRRPTKRLARSYAALNGPGSKGLAFVACRSWQLAFDSCAILAQDALGLLQQLPGVLEVFTHVLRHVTARPAAWTADEWQRMPIAVQHHLEDGEKQDVGRDLLIA